MSVYAGRFVESGNGNLVKGRFRCLDCHRSKSHCVCSPDRRLMRIIVKYHCREAWPNLDKRPLWKRALWPHAKKKSHKKKIVWVA